MASERIAIGCLGAGRMGRGIAVHFAYAGHPVTLFDLKPRAAGDFAALAAAAHDEIAATLSMLADLGLGDAAAVPAIAARVTILPAAEAAALRDMPVVFEGVPEILDLKRAALAEAAALMAPDAILASTTSTIMVDDLSPAVPNPARFLNAHWLNPAYLVPLVEISPGQHTDPAVTARLMETLESVGKVPVRCAPSPGFIIPRIQALAMNEAARLVEEGVASAEDIDRALRYGFSFRFGVLGMLEFIDWGGVDILHHASRYLESSLGDARYRAPAIVGRHMAEGKLGMGTGSGFLPWAEMDIAAHKRRRLGELIARLRAEGLARPPVLPPA
ncbi:3-hydroxybutyryl-CoA dehydrogenase [Roseomonas stagni]|uniref:L-gulonate 3-dehydrogenase n=1 Tax=Falsiroseomonas algicola TaxID=2716930 RepID=A0A6M1LHE8_9PROT|nr:3-hydroxybutyryl-CoA dehydrogenase [Falsiroseomonas algicola]NGM19795.1 3-hydroxybutyryl-CoA dehydrogenase [Falsiroseomonas algicola]